MPKTFGISLQMSSILHWNMSPTGTAPNSRHLYWYLPNGQANVVRYDDLVSNCRLWYPKLASIIDIYFTLLSLGNMLFDVGPLCMGLISAWFSLTGSKHNLTLLFALGTNTKLLHHSANSSTPRGVMMSIFCRHSSSFLNGFCNAYATHLSSTWYGLLSGLSCKENVPSKHPIPLKHPQMCCVFPGSVWCFFFYLPLHLMMRKIISYLFALSCPVWPVAPCLIFESASVFV